MQMKMLGIDHIGICARDPKVLADWYINNFGFTLHSVGNAGNYFVESPDKILLEIMVPMKDHDIDAKEPAIGWKHIALVPEDFDEAVKETARRTACKAADAEICLNSKTVERLKIALNT